MTITERIKQFIDYKELKVSYIEKRIGASEGVLRRSFKNKSDINSKWLGVFSEKFPEINSEWLLTGKGKMLKTNSYENLNTINKMHETNLIHEPKVPEKKYFEQSIPLFDVMATASVISLFEDTNRLQVVDTIQIPNMPKCDGAIAVTGDSMYPLIKSGDLILYKTINNFKHILYGNMYLIALNVGGDEMLMVKYLHKGSTHEYLKLVSENRFHEDVEVHFDDIISIAIVKGNVRYNFIR